MQKYVQTKLSLSRRIQRPALQLEGEEQHGSPKMKLSAAEVEKRYGERLENTLKLKFGHTSFRPSQKKVILSVLSGEDTFVLMPTGAGKSLCFQLPALLLDGVTIVVSPLIALMHNQVEKLQQNGIAAALLCSSQKKDERERVRQDILSKEPKTKLLYVTPELIDTQNFLGVLYTLRNNKRLALFVVDEAHAISEWGHDFRGSYRKLSLFKERFSGIPVCALTATATSRVQKDVVDSLRLDKPLIVTLSFNRPNIYYEVRFKDNLVDVYGDIVSFIQPNACGIVYCHKRETCQHVATKLKECGISAEAYHAGLKDAQRGEVQNKWMSGQTQVMVATIAFGMGIDKQDVRFVIHFDVPKNLEGFYQESGRAGRDGKPAISLLYYSKDDKSMNSYLLAQAAEKKAQRQNGTTISPTQQHKQRQSAVDLSWEKMIEYCEGAPSCRRRRLLAYFGENISSRSCDGCDYCRNSEAVTKSLRDFHTKGVSTKSLAYAQQQLKTLSKGIRTARKALNKGEEEEEVDEVDEEDYYEQEREQWSKPLALRPTVQGSGSEEKFWADLEKLEQREEARSNKRKFGKFGHLLGSFQPASTLAKKMKHERGFPTSSTTTTTTTVSSASSSTTTATSLFATASSLLKKSSARPPSLFEKSNHHSLHQSTTTTTTATPPSSHHQQTKKPKTKLYEIDIL